MSRATLVLNHTRLQLQSAQEGKHVGTSCFPISCRSLLSLRAVLQCSHCTAAQSETEGKSQHCQNMLSPLTAQCIIPTRDAPQKTSSDWMKWIAVWDRKPPNCNTSILYHVVKVTCKVNRKRCQSVRLFFAAPYPCRGHPSLSGMWFKAGLLSTDLSLPASGRHQGNADMNVIHMMETSHFYNPFPLPVTEDEFNCTFVRCHIVGSLQKKGKASILNNTKIPSIKPETDYSTCALNILEDKLNFTCKDSKNNSQFFLLFPF